ncbi:MAG TPA: cytochrome c oxidase assembly protein [Roseiarcus sp.]|nr:cytochrome c oxidase assembly protein [Roseiarcus sp.]
MSAFIPYCGAPPIPGHESWNLDPFLIGALAAGGAFLGWRIARHAATPGWRLHAFGLGWLILSLAFVSPLCNISVALFSARAAQHILLTLCAAPLIAWGVAALPQREKTVSTGSLSASVMAFAAILWFWHSPAPYDETLRNNLVYWLMHISTAGAALWLWLATFRSRAWPAFFAISATGLQMSFLGALLTFARAPLFSVHQFTTAAWGLTWIGDQQLGGLLMWAPSGLLLTAYSIVGLALLLRRLDAPLSGGAAKPI